MIDENIIGNYRIIKEIGEGGMSYVFLAEHMSLKSKRAIKMLAPHLTGAPGFKERFLKEGLAQAQLEHNNIVKVVDYFEQNKKTFLVMEYIEGKCLNEIIELKGRLKEHDAIKIAKDVLNALNYAHMQNVVHRDIKPSNIIIASNGKAMLMDFGIAFMVGDKRLTNTGMNIGTSLYMSPEQITTPQKIDHRVDVYSMGVVLYEMLTGDVPFDGDNDYIIKDKHVRELPPSIRQKFQDISKAMEGIVMKALEKNPDNRFNGCGEFLEFIIALESEIEDHDTGGKNQLNISNSDVLSDSEINSDCDDETELIDKPDAEKLENESSLNQHEITENDNEKSQTKNKKLIPLFTIITVITIFAFVFITFIQDKDKNNYETFVQLDQKHNNNKYNNEDLVEIDQKDSFDEPSENSSGKLNTYNNESINYEEPQNKQISKEIDQEVFEIKLAPNDNEEYDNPITKAEIKQEPSFKSIVVNSLNMEFKHVSNGSFMMGTSTNETGRDNDEIQHKVLISKDFFMQTKEITQEQFNKVMGYNPSWHSVCSNCPVEKVSWYKVNEFIEILNQKYEEREKGRKYRLPTEAEWEYVCRAKSNTPFYFGFSLSDNHANYGKSDKYGTTTLPVGSYKPNEWGFYDMHGNVSEWCSDWYASYPSGISIDPQITLKVKFNRKIVRGGAWNDKETTCRSGNRMRVVPSTDDANNIGFRLVMMQDE